MRKVGLAVLCFVLAINGQTVHITGTVSNASSQPVAGAVVKLFGAAMSCTTKTDGTYELTGQTGIKMPGYSSRSNAFGVSCKNGSFAFNAPQPINVSARLFDLRGRMVARLYSGVLNRGITRVALPQNVSTRSMMILHVKSTAGNAEYTLVPMAGGTFALHTNGTTLGQLRKTASLDWIQAAKTGLASSVKPLDAYTGVVDFTLGALAEPYFGTNVKIFDPTLSMTSIQSTMDGFSTAQFSTNRVAWFFKPGSYTVNISLRYYIQAYGLGMSPEDVQITGAVQDVSGNNTGSFWRGAEGFSCTPSGTDLLGVSQAIPLRRLHIKAPLRICDGGASGGFMSDSKIDGAISTTCAQQFYIRNSMINGCPTSGIWNFLFQGCDNPPAENWPSGGISVVAKTPLVREKPFLTFDNTSDRYSVFVPALRSDAQGITWANGGNSMAGETLPIDQFYIAIAGTDNATTINAALAQGKNLLLTPGIYMINTPILVQRPNTVVLGIGMATLQAQNGSILMKTSNAPGIIIANILFECGTGGVSPVLFQAGEQGGTEDNSANPPFVFDLFARAGGSVDGKCVVACIFNSNNLILDHSWIWRADHGTGAGWSTDSTVLKNGLIINGNNCITYGQMVEHWQKYNTIWNGNNGRQYFYQHEYNYDTPNQESWMEGSVLGMPAIKVTNQVTNFYGWGLGIYSYMRRAAVTTTNAIETPKVPGISVHRIVTFALGGDQGTILHAINDTGTAVKNPSPTMIRFGDYVGH